VPRHPDHKPLGDTLREFREAAGISQEKLADKVGIDRTVIGATERAERNVGYRQIRRVLVTLGVSWTEFGRELDKRDQRRR